MDELKLRIRKTGVQMKVFAKKCGLKYNTITGYLNEFVDMPDHDRETIEWVLKGLEG